jgi:carbon-monoxide dehydrogenase medium subunit
VTPFEFLQPSSLREALALLDPDDPDVRPFAGGTALMLMMKGGVLKPRRLISLQRIEPQYAGISMAGEHELRLGALATLSAVEHSPLVRRAAPVVGAAMPRLSNVRVRNVATVGGGLAHADPHMDLPPVLCALRAQVSIRGPRGDRTLPVEDLITGYLETALRRDELITEVRIPVRIGQTAAYLKCTSRSADDWPALGVAVSIERDGTAVRACNVIIAAATDKPTHARSAESELLGRDAADPCVVARAAQAAAAELLLHGDAMGTADYKRQLVRVYAGRAIRAALAAAPAAWSHDAKRTGSD